ncbi:hypothetical protein H5410_005952 [Solanum commersonii]|uniref:Uncharacterized protein n=1 Tax=Solanum commersonii TaxID=4109 RepID=A0A9J6A7U3_SOLCO|nr:hypothetical protein H5410_005952 [Solanum commersonii]
MSFKTRGPEHQITSSTNRGPEIEINHPFSKRSFGPVPSSTSTPVPRPKNDQKGREFGSRSQGNVDRGYNLTLFAISVESSPDVDTVLYKDTTTYLVELDMVDFDVILGMGGLYSCYALVEYGIKVVKFHFCDELIFEWKDSFIVAKGFFISYLKPQCCERRSPFAKGDKLRRDEALTPFHSVARRSEKGDFLVAEPRIVNRAETAAHCSVFYALFCSLSLLTAVSI